jgi:TPR repeat protein
MNIFDFLFNYGEIKAAEQGNMEAQYKLGLMYENGELVKEDIDAAIKWHRKAFEQGHKEAIYKLT